MSTTRIKVNGMSVGTLKKILEDIPHDCEITVCNVGNGGYVDDCELEIIEYENFKTDVCLNIKAESGYY